MKKMISAGGIVYKKLADGSIQWLLCQHAQYKGWVFPKGIVGDTYLNETYEEAGLRETREEGGIEAKIIAQLSPVEYEYELDNEKISKKVHYYLMEYLSGSPSDHDSEISDAGFFTEDEVIKTLTYLTDRNAFEEALVQFKRRN